MTAHPSSRKYPQEYAATGKNNMYYSALNAGEVQQKSTRNMGISSLQASNRRACYKNKAMRGSRQNGWLAAEFVLRPILLVNSM